LPALTRERDVREAYAAHSGESVGDIGIYKFEAGKRDKHLQRLSGLEENYRT